TGHMPCRSGSPHGVLGCSQPDSCATPGVPAASIAAATPAAIPPSRNIRSLIKDLRRFEKIKSYPRPPTARADEPGIPPRPDSRKTGEYTRRPEAGSSARGLGSNVSYVYL